MNTIIFNQFISPQTICNKFNIFDLIYNKLTNEYLDIVDNNILKYVSIKFIFIHQTDFVMKVEDINLKKGSTIKNKIYILAYSNYDTSNYKTKKLKVNKILKIKNQNIKAYCWKL